MPAVLFRVEIPTATGPVSGRIAVEQGPMRMAEIVPLASALTDLLVERAAEQERAEGRRISCQAGCGACCRQMVPLSVPEVFYLGEVVGRQPADRSSHLFGRFDRVIRGLREDGLFERLTAADVSQDEEMALARRYFDLGLECPFLEKEQCSIHRERPVGCREFNVTSPPAHCTPPLGDPVVRVPMPRPLSEPLAQLAADVLGVPMRLIPLSLAPVWARSHDALGRRSFPGPELFGRFAELAGGKAAPAGGAHSQRTRRC